MAIRNPEATEATVGRTADEIAALNSGTYFPSSAERILVDAGANPWMKRLTAAIAAVAGIEAVHVFEPKAIPAIVQYVQGTLESYGTTLTQAKEIFDPKSTSGKIGQDNSVSVSIDEIREKTRIENGKAIYIGSIFDLPQGKNVNYVKGLPDNGGDKGIYEPLQAARQTPAFP